MVEWSRMKECQEWIEENGHDLNALEKEYMDKNNRENIDCFEFIYFVGKKFGVNL